MNKTSSKSRISEKSDILTSAAFVTVGLVVMFIWTPAFDPINLSKASILISAGLPLTVLIVYKLVKKPSKKLLVLLPCLIFIAYIAFRMFDVNQSLWRKTIGTFTRSNGGLTLISLVLITLAISLSTYNKNIQYWRRMVLIIATIQIVYGVLQLTNLDPIEWNYQVSNRLLTTLGNPNFASAIFGILGAATCPLIFTKAFKIRYKVFYTLLTICCLVLSYATSSIQGPIAMIGGLVFVGLLIPTIYKKHRNYRIMGISTIFLAGLGLLTIYFSSPITFDKMFSYTFDLRKYYWSAAIRMMEQSPLIGVGIDSYGENYRLLRGYAVTQAYSPFVYSNNAHNVPLQIGATLGWVGLVLYLAIQIMALAAIVRMVINKQKILTTTEIGLIAAWIAFQLQNLVSVDQIGVQIIGWCISGILISNFFINDKSTVPNYHKGILSFFVVGILISSFYALGSLYKDVNLKNAMLTPYNPNDSTSISQRSQIIYEAAKGLSQDATYVALAAENIYQTGDHELAIKLALENVERFPTTTESLSTALVLLENENRFKEAYELRKRMQKSDPFNWENLYVLAQSAQKLNYTQEARTYYQQIVSSPSSVVRKLDAQKALSDLN